MRALSPRMAVGLTAISISVLAAGGITSTYLSDRHANAQRDRIEALAEEQTRIALQAVEQRSRIEQMMQQIIAEQKAAAEQRDRIETLLAAHIKR